MTAPNEPVLPFGLRYVRLYALNSAGTPAAVDETAYEGLQIKGATAFDLSFPEPRKITGLGEDGVTAVAYLPPTDSVTGTLAVDADDPDISAIVTKNLIRTLGDMSLAVSASDNQGFEPLVGLICSQACVGLETGAQYWRSYILPAARVIMRDGAMTADKSATQYSVAPSVVTAHLWGETIGTAEGATSAQLVKAWSNNPVRVSAFVGDGTTTAFTFPVAAPSVATYATSTKVFVNGAEVTSGITITATSVTFTVAPAAAARIAVVRETAKFIP